MIECSERTPNLRCYNLNYIVVVELKQMCSIILVPHILLLIHHAYPPKNQAPAPSNQSSKGMLLWFGAIMGNEA